jgi:hypothetical protein
MLEGLFYILFVGASILFFTGIASKVDWGEKLVYNFISLLLFIICWPSSLMIEVPSTGDVYTEYGFQIICFLGIILNIIFIIIWSILFRNQTDNQRYYNR